jgi:RecA/RadA recombinase
MSDAEKLLQKINDKLKVDVIKPAAKESIVRNYIPTGIVEMDLRLGGGWPFGCISILYGPPSGGKTLVALLTIANAQKTCRKCYTQFEGKAKCSCGKCEPCKTLYIDAENSWTNQWSSTMGINLELVYVAHPRYMEEAFDIVDVFIREEAVDLIVLDSVIALSPKSEKEDSVEKQQQALLPRVYSKALRKWASELAELVSNGRHVPVSLFINQTRMKVGIVYGNPEIMPGGDAQKFYGTSIVRVSKKAIEMSEDDEDPRPLKQTTKFVVEKSKCNWVKLEGLFDVTLHPHVDDKGVKQNTGGIDNNKVLLNYARKFHVIEEKPGKYLWAGNEWKNQEEILQALSGSMKMRGELFKATLTAYKEYIPSSSGKKDEATPEN